MCKLPGKISPNPVSGVWSLWRGEKGRVAGELPGHPVSTAAAIVTKFLSLSALSPVLSVQAQRRLGNGEYDILEESGNMLMHAYRETWNDSKGLSQRQQACSAQRH